MQKLLSIFNFKAYKYKLILVISTLVLLCFAYLLFFPSKTYFDCPFKSTSNDYEKAYVTVNKYFGGVRYTLNDYKLSQCNLRKSSDNEFLDYVHCESSDFDYLSFNIIDGSIVSGYKYKGFPFMYYRGNTRLKCSKIIKAVD